MSEKTANAPRMMSMRRIAQTGLLSEYSLRQMHRRGQLPCLDLPNKVLVNYDKLIEMLANLGEK